MSTCPTHLLSKQVDMEDLYLYLAVSNYIVSATLILEGVKISVLHV